MSTKKSGVQHGMQGVFVFVLLGLFALMSTLLVLLGAQMYRGTVAEATDNNDRRVLSAYVRGMVRAEDGYEAVKIEDHDGIRALAMYEEIEGERYVTWIYQYDGQLYEQFTDASYEFDPEDGDPVVPAGSFEPELEDGLLTVRMTDESNELSIVRVALRCAR